MIKHFDIEVNKHKLELIVDLERDHWYVLFPKYGQYASGDIGHGSFERNHNFLVIGSRDYEIVFDCDDDHTRWDSVSIFDIKKQEYLPECVRLDGGEMWKVHDKSSGKLINTVFSENQAEFEVLFYKQQTGKESTYKRIK
jgi:hypothetical protein